MTELPAMIAGSTELIIVRNGKLIAPCIQQSISYFVPFKYQTENGIPTHFHGAITKTTPRASRRINLLNPVLSVSFRCTSASDLDAIESM